MTQHKRHGDEDDADGGESRQAGGRVRAGSDRRALPKEAFGNAGLGRAGVLVVT
jgi:hypothetical protein